LPGHPAFLKPQPAQDRFNRPAFVARERELAYLDGCLENVLSGHGQVVFITGEAGTGKTALVGAFAHRAESRHAGLLVATGNCSAYTGAGDPYLPFREILAQLTGDVEGRWAAGRLSTLSARRLWRTLPFAVQSLLERSPGKYLIVSHGGILNMVLHAIIGITPQADLQGPRFRFRNTSFASLIYRSGENIWIVDSINDREHWHLSGE